jgi:hypothetical protein
LPAYWKKFLAKKFGVLSYEKNLYRNAVDLLLGAKKYYRPAGQGLVVLVCDVGRLGSPKSEAAGCRFLYLTFMGFATTRWKTRS